MGATGWGAWAALAASAAGAVVQATTKGPRSPGPPPVMPDQTSVLQSQQLREAKSASLQYGRAATILTGAGTAGAASTGDRLGP
jgi:hypothetical protein